MKKNLVVLLSLFIVGAASAQESRLEFTPTGESTASVAAASTDISGVVVIPETAIINGKEYTVTSVAQSGFSRCSQLEEVVFHEKIWEIDHDAFWGSGIKRITIPASTTKIGYSVFDYCLSLESIKVAEGNPVYFTIDGILMGNTVRYADNCMIAAPANLEMKEYVVPKEIGSIAEHAFSYHKFLERLVIPPTVSTISYEAFYGCENLKEVEWQASAPTIPRGCFADCNSMTSFVIPESVKHIDINALPASLRSVTIRNGNPIGIEDNSFRNEVYENATLFVPRGSAKMYRSAAVWKKFKHIEEVDMPGIEVQENHYAALEDNQMILGYYRSENCQSPFDEYGGMDEGTQYAYIGFDKEWMTPFKNNYIRNIRFAMKDTTSVYDVKVFIGSKQLKDDICLQEVKLPKIGWNEVELQKPYLITGDSIFVGVQFKLRAFRDYPLEWIYGGEEGSFYRYGTVGGAEKPYQYWDWGKDRRYALCVQCLVEGDHLPENVVHYSGLDIDQKYVKPGETITGTLHIRNTGNNPIQDVTLSAHISGKEYPVSIIKHPTPDQNTFDDNSVMRDLRFRISLNGTPELGKNEIKVDVQTMNGSTFQYVGGKRNQHPFKFYSKTINRDKIFVELFSSAWCENSYWGFESIGALKQQFPEAACVMYYRGAPEDICEKYISTLIAGFPTVYLNRYAPFGAESLQENRSGVDEAIRAFENAKSCPAFANVNIESQYDENSRKLQVKVYGIRNEEFMPVEGYTHLTVHLVEDDVTIDTNDKTEIQDDILRGCMTDIWGDLVEWNGDSYEMNYEMELPESWKPEKMRIIAFLAKPFKGNNYDELDVVNCNEAKLGGKSTTGISEIIIDTQHGNHDGIYNLNGQLISSDQWRELPKGIYIKNGKKYIK